MTGPSALIFLCFTVIVRNICFFVHDFWHREPNPWHFLSAESNQGIKSFCYVHKVNFRKPRRMGETNKWSEDWNFQSHPSWPLGMGEGLEVGSVANGRWFNQPGLCNEVSIKTRKDFVQRASGLVEWWTFRHVGRMAQEKTNGSSAPLPTSLTHAFLPTGSSWIILLCNNQWSSKYTVSLSSVSCSGKLIESKEKVLKTSDF